MVLSVISVAINPHAQVYASCLHPAFEISELMINEKNVFR